MATTPAVSVIVAAYNSGPYLEAALGSLARQTIGMDRMQVILVDDGSTDDTAALLDRFAARHPGTVVLYQENSGSPASPRNRALEYVLAPYVFFFDADDTLADDTLRAAVAMAEENGTDVVLVRMRGTGHRGTPRLPFTRTLPRTDVHTSNAYWTLNPIKLFRTEVVRRAHLTFALDLPWGEDQPFTAGAMLAGGGISILADRDYVYWHRRDDASNITYRAASLADRLPVARHMFKFVAERVAPGTARDRLMRRHFVIELVDSALPGFGACEDADERHAAFEEFRVMVAAHLTPELETALPPRDRVPLALVARDREDLLLAYSRRLAAEHDPPVIIESDRIYLALPGFRDEDWGLPDELFEVGERLHIDCLLDRLAVSRRGVHIHAEGRLGDLTPGITAIELVARSADGTLETVLPLRWSLDRELVRDADRAFFTVDDTLAPARLLRELPEAALRLYLRVTAGAVVRESRLVECALPPQHERVIASGPWRPAVGRLRTSKTGRLSIAVRRSPRAWAGARVRAMQGR